MPTRQQADFEKSLVEALRSTNVASAISEAIITNITKKLAEKFTYYDTKISALEAEIKLLKSTTEISEKEPLNDERIQYKQKIDNLEQRSKNNNIRLMGLKEENNENTLDMVKHLLEQKFKMNVDDGDITAAYRVSQNTAERPKHIIIMFKDNQTKNKIFRVKKMLKGSNIVMKEDLTNERLKLVKEASDKYGYKNVWTFNGIIFAKTENGVEKISLRQ